MLYTIFSNWLSTKKEKEINKRKNVSSDTFIMMSLSTNDARSINWLACFCYGMLKKMQVVCDGKWELKIINLAPIMDDSCLSSVWEFDFRLEFTLVDSYYYTENLCFLSIPLHKLRNLFACLFAVAWWIH